MADVTCPECNECTNVYRQHYKGNVQCRRCGIILEAVIYDGIVSDVTIAIPTGYEVKGLPDDIEKAYAETRRCMVAKCYTAAELLCRKILMHVAVEKGAKEGDSFVSYLTFLEKNGFVAPQMLTWLDLIRKHGNLAAHSLQDIDHERAESTVTFTAELLRMIYEMEFLAKRFTQKKMPKK